MGLAQNCCKHILAELKHYHVNDLQNKNVSAGEGKCQSIPRIPPPVWSPAVLQSTCKGSGNENLALEDGNDSDCDDDDETAETPIGSVHALAQIHQQLDNLLPKVGGAIPVTEYINSIAQLSEESQGQNATFERPRKRPRGNAGFFMRLRDQRAVHPRMQSESNRDYEARLRAEASRSWKDVRKRFG